MMSYGGGDVIGTGALLLPCVVCVGLVGCHGVLLSIVLLPTSRAVLV